MSSLAFSSPLILGALILLPLLWVILRALPPQPKRILFSAVTLLQGLKDRETSAAKTPWWLILLRCFVVGLIIIALAGPMLKNSPGATQKRGQTMIVVDGGWAHANTSKLSKRYVLDHLREALGTEERFAVLDLAEPGGVVWKSPQDQIAFFENWDPKPVELDPKRAQQALAQMTETTFDSLWLSDGLAHANARQDILVKLLAAGSVTVFEPEADFLMLRGVSSAGGDFGLRVEGAGPKIPEGSVRIHGLDPSGASTILSEVPFSAPPNMSEIEINFDLPNELRARVTKVDVVGQSHIGANYVIADQLRRPKVGIIATTSSDETINVFDPMHFVKTAIEPFADLQIGTIEQLLLASPDILISADIVSIPNASAVLEWVRGGGLLIRFAGPRIAAAADTLLRDDPLMPVVLRNGGRNFGGAMSWDTPKRLAAFDAQGVFGGLAIPEDILINTQVLAQPELELNSKTLAKLEDQTPLVTALSIGSGRSIFFHTTANAQWSNLPLSGLFVDMLSRLIRPGLRQENDFDLAGTKWTPIRTLDAFGNLTAGDDLRAVDGARLSSTEITKALPIGVYASQDHTISRNVGDILPKIIRADWPDIVKVKRDVEPPDTQDLRAPIWIVAFALLIADLFASAWVSGRLLAFVVIMFAVSIATPRAPLFAEQIVPDEIALAHVKTSDRTVDEIAFAGLLGLTETLFLRTSIEPSPPVSVDLEKDDIALFPLLYWPITDQQPIPSDQSYAKLNSYLASGGVILFDTRDAGQSRAISPVNGTLRRLLSGLNIPPLDIVPADHVLTRAFYLLQSFPGRYAEGSVWIEAAPENTVQGQDRPFRALNDGVTPVLIGGNDWAAAWAIDDQGRALLPVGRGFSGERQREMARRFGVNLVMHVLMGNYKSDQVHVPALLERLGQ